MTLIQSPHVDSNPFFSNMETNVRASKSTIPSSTSRRRRKPKSNQEDIIYGSSDKENNFNTSLSASGVLLGDGEFHYTKSQNKELEIYNFPCPFSFPSESSNDTIQSILENINPELIAVLQSASDNYPKVSIKGSILLEEQKNEILNMVRRCIRSVGSCAKETCKDDSMDDTPNQLLHIAIHSLRAIVPLILSQCCSKSNSTSSVAESVVPLIKILYHCIASSEKTDIMVSIQGYHLLGLCIKKLLSSFQGGCYETADVLFFPVAKGIWDSSSVDSFLTMEQLIKIVVHCILVVSVKIGKLLNDNECGTKKIQMVAKLLSPAQEMSLSSIVSLHRFLRETISKVLMSWILLPLHLGSEESRNVSIQQDQWKLIFTQSSQGSKLLLDVASKMESNSVNDKVMIQRVVELQQDAILVSLLWYQDDRSKWMHPKCNLHQKAFEPIMKKIFEKACIQAHKVSTHCYKVSENQSSNHLQTFHDHVGPALLRCAKVYGINHSYLDYHTGEMIQGGTFGSRVYPFDDESDIGGTILKLFVFAFSNMNNLRRDEVSTTEEPFDMQECQEIIDQFYSAVIENNYVGLDWLQLAYRILFKLKLSQFVSERTSEVEDVKGADCIRHLSIAKVLSECWGPLNYRLHSKLENDGKHLSIAIDSYLKVINFLDHVQPEEGCDYPCLNESNDCIHRCHSICIKSISAFPEMALSVAKSLSNVARRRSSFESILPHLASLDLFVRLGSVQGSSLPIRFMQFSNLLLSLSLRKHALCALYLALCFQAKLLDQCEISSMIIDPGNIILLCDDYVSGRLSFGDVLCSGDLPQSLSSIMNKIVKLYYNISCNEEGESRLGNPPFTYPGDVSDIVSSLISFPDAYEFCPIEFISKCEGIFNLSVSTCQRLQLELVERIGAELFIKPNQSCGVHKVREICDRIKIIEDRMQHTSVLMTSIWIVLSASIRVAGKKYENALYEQHAHICIVNAENVLNRVLDVAVSDQEKITHMFEICCLSFHRCTEEEDKRKQEDWGDLIINGMFSLLQYNDFMDSVETLLGMVFEISPEQIDISDRLKNALSVTLYCVSHRLESSGSGACCVRLQNIMRRYCELDDKNSAYLERATSLTLGIAEFHSISLDIDAENLDQSVSSIVLESESLLRESRKLIEGAEVNGQVSLRLPKLLHKNGILIHLLAFSLPISSLSLFLEEVQRIKSSYTVLKKISQESSMRLPLTMWFYHCESAVFEGMTRIGDFIKAFQSSKICYDLARETLIWTNNEVSNLNRLDDENFVSSYVNIMMARPFLRRIWNECIRNRAVAYFNLGDWRKATKYISFLAESMNLIPKSLASSAKTSLHDFIKVMNIQCSTIQHLKVKRTLATIVSSSLASSEFEHQISQVLMTSSDCNSSSAFNIPFLPNAEYELHHSTLDWTREAIYFLLCLGARSCVTDESTEYAGINIDDSLLGHCKSLINIIDSGKESMHLKTFQSAEKFVGSCIKDNPSFQEVLSMTKLKFMKNLLKGEYNSDCVLRSLNDISTSEYTASIYQAEALYLESSIFMKYAKNDGSLQRLWNHEESLNEEELMNLERAKSLLRRGLELCGPANSLLTRNIMRCLALVSGPESMSAKYDIKAGELVHSSIGSSARQLAARHISDECDLKDIFDAMDIPFSNPSKRLFAFKKLSSFYRTLIPQNWVFVAFALCPDGEILVSTVKISNDADDEPFIYNTTAIFPFSGTNIFNSIFQPFDHLMERSRRQLSGLDESTANERNTSRDQKQAYWDERHAIDEALEEILMNLDYIIFQSASHFDGVTNQLYHDDDDEHLCGNLAARFEAVVLNGDVDSILPEVKSEDLESMTVVQLKERLTETFGITSKDLRPLRKQGLLELLVKKMNEANFRAQAQSEKENSQDRAVADPKSCTFLILDENFTRLPFEGLNTFKGKSVCRVPSIAFAVSSLFRLKTGDNDRASFDASKTSVVLDAEANLLKTQDRILSVLSNITCSNGWDWKQVVGKRPTKAFIKDALKLENGIFLYFGHATGERYFSKTDIENLSRCGQNGKSDCNAAVVLMGCSSGDLASVNFDRTLTVAENEMLFEPEGAVLSYLCAGAPTVVGNLWDVTDRDIDKFSISFLEKMYDGHHDIPGCVAKSRHVCRMKNLVGCAPVVYGIPVVIGKNAESN